MLCVSPAAALPAVEVSEVHVPDDPAPPGEAGVESDNEGKSCSVKVFSFSLLSESLNRPLLP